MLLTPIVKEREMESAYVLLLVASVLAGAAGFFYLSEATLGIGIIGIAALLGIWSRIIQAVDHNNQVKKSLLEENTKVEDRTVWLRNELLSVRKGPEKTSADIKYSKPPFGL
jgi:hypothetical protein